MRYLHTALAMALLILPIHAQGKEPAVSEAWGVVVNGDVSACCS